MNGMGVSLCIWFKRSVFSVKNIISRSKMMSLLSSIPSSNPGRLDRILALEFILLGMWWSVKSYSCINVAH